MNDVAQQRAPEEVMRLERMGSFHPFRLSFSRQLLRSMANEAWEVAIDEWAIDASGFGHGVITARQGDYCYSLVAFSHDIAQDERSDRVIAERWDATFSLVAGYPDAKAIQRLAETVSKQEAARHHHSQLTLSRANKSVRMFRHVVDCLAAGRQPDAKMVNEIGYLMRTTAVYGNGKFGIGDRLKLLSKPLISGTFQAEMLTVYLIRHFSLALIEHLAKQKGGTKAVALDRRLARHFGIGNATGLGMAPFLVHHQELLHCWMLVRETALARVMNLSSISHEQAMCIEALVGRARKYTKQWRVDDPIQMARIIKLEADLEILESWLIDDWWQEDMPLLALKNKATQHLSLEAEEMLISVLMEPFGELIDGLADCMSVDERRNIPAAACIQDALDSLERHYAWVFDIDTTVKAASALFWYVSEAKLEPRLGRRYEEDGASQETPFDIVQRIKDLKSDLTTAEPSLSLTSFMLDKPQHRYILKRVMLTKYFHYGEIQDNLVADGMRPIDMLRCKLSFFGASKFDPKSDLWTRIALFQGAPLADEISHQNSDDWLFAHLEAVGA